MSVLSGISAFKHIKKNVLSSKITAGNVFYTVVGMSDTAKSLNVIDTRWEVSKTKVEYK